LNSFRIAKLVFILSGSHASQTVHFFVEKWLIVKIKQRIGFFNIFISLAHKKYKKNVYG